MPRRRDTALESLSESLRQKKLSGALDTKKLLAQIDADSSSDDDQQVSAGAARAVYLKLLQRKRARAGKK